MQYSSLLLKSGRDRSVTNRHPWIFSGAVKQLPSAQDGDIVAVRDNHGALLGYGFFSPRSQIVVRMFAFTTQELSIDQHYWNRKIQDAFALRKAHLDFAETTCYRLLHAEGDFLPGVIVDVYGSVAVMQLMIRGTERIHAALLEALRTVGIEKVWLKNKEAAQRLEDVRLPNGWLTDLSEEGPAVVVRENGLQFAVDYERGQKTGFFLDQRENRALLQQVAKGAKVLNAFSYTGGFSVYALAGGATEVHSVDISQEAVERAHENVVLNYGSDAPHRTFAEDCFKYLKNMEESYNIIILDPPAFAKNARAVPNATRGYKEINLWAFRKVQPGGLVFTFSCSQNIDRDLFRKVVFGAAADAGRNVRILHQLTQPLDHPVNIYHPEGEYLKGLVLYVS
ncbi:23S rRNA (cytosine1962-C5)-methyltransferase [Catalinimonas alkaloidigena]|uniref:23S rRNA (Cytosine1962-C5)-methyltransferase n=1 Tax=Catalinimonas alkaloidigena TaxID=1075417 RepID=A0A1G8WJV5_9BACT|nr:class I SAM-dependent rRNA methyltransferase [Catalinimonas alkaloidigena]SDJ78353.1 23S rRNA (cytosine1962-C5)-methyltransferase [Catalinimonas alkaloidigena]